MSSSQRATRRSARHAFEDDDGPPAKRTRTDEGGAPMTNGKVKQAKGKANGVASKKAKAAYDENDDGFTFSRTRSKKTQTRAAPPELVPAPEPKAATPPPAPTTARKKKYDFSTPEPKKKEAKPKRRSARLSAEHQEQHEQLPEKTKTAKRPAEPEPSSDAEGKVYLVDRELQVEKKRSENATKIALPFADTPIIRRNKEMRKGGGDSHRRSSSGIRGRRASSLIDSGTSHAIPHIDVETTEFYKLIEQNLPEPRRMKQLLTWCGTRSLPEKTTGSQGDANATLAADAARHIQDELVADFANKSEMSDWFNRPDDVPNAVLVKKPNPRNIQNSAKLKELEEEIKRLQDEKRSWETLVSTSTAPPLPTSSNDKSTQIDTSLLDDPAQAAILSTLQEPSASSDLSQIQSRIQVITSNLEPQIDLFADGVHKLGQYRLAAERVADRILGASAERVEQRQTEVRMQSGAPGFGTEDALRALGKVLNER